MKTLVAGRLFWAAREGFLYPGLVVWARRRHWRVLPIPATPEARRARVAARSLR